MGLEEILNGNPNYIAETIQFTDGSLIRAANPQMLTGRTQHSDGRKYGLIMFDVSSYARPGDTFYLTTPYKVVLEKELNANGTCDPLTRDEMISYTCDYVGQLLANSHDDDRICRFIGRKMPDGQMIVSPVIKKMVDEEIEPRIEQARLEKIEQQRQKAAREENERAKEFEKEAAIINSKYEQERDAKRRARLQSQKLDYVGVAIDGKSGNYNGVDLNSGDVLRVRSLCKHGKDPETNIYFYTAGVSVTGNEYDVEMLSACNQQIAFATAVRIEDLIQTPEGRYKALKLFSDGNAQSEYGGEVKFMGMLDKNGDVVSTELESCPATIQTAYNNFNQKVMADQDAERKAYAEATKKMQEDKEI